MIEFILYGLKTNKRVTKVSEQVNQIYMDYQLSLIGVIPTSVNEPVEVSKPKTAWKPLFKGQEPPW